MTVLKIENVDQENSEQAQFISEFEAKFNEKPDFLVRVPGRVNLIGEHIDYCGYGVHPMAIEQDILVGIKMTEAGLHIVNKDSAKYQPFSLASVANLEISTEQIHWASYFLCGVKGVHEELNVSNPSGMKVYMSGRVPASAGLSSSSAVVVSGAIATICCNGLEVDRVELASLCARAERFIGTQGGGMDQAIEILAESGQANLIEFNPLVATPVTLPVGAVFVIANSLEEKNKAASNHFNSRVVECRLSAKILAKRLLKGDEWKEVLKLKEVATRSGNSLEEMLAQVDACLHSQAYTREEILKELDVTDQYLRENVLTANTQDLLTFRLHQRAKHVYSEAARVYHFRDTCLAAAGDGDSLRKLGALMTASHASCRDDYECSAPELDRLVETSLKLGAYGSRLTGAGWGGCTVSLVPTEGLSAYMEGLAKFYSGKADIRFEEVAFVTKPSSGAQAWRI